MIIRPALAARVLDRLDEHTVNQYDVEYDTPAWEAMLEWVKFHGLDPFKILGGPVIVRDQLAHVITYTSFVAENGTLVPVDQTERGEAGPLPLPPEVLALAGGTTGVTA